MAGRGKAADEDKHGPDGEREEDRQQRDDGRGP
jgi:hypothetical protein